MFISVLLPEPDAPMIATSSPGLIARSMPCSTSTARSPLKYVFLTPQSSISGVVSRVAVACFAATGNRDGAAGNRDELSGVIA